MNSILLFLGSFDPPHLGHMSLLESVGDFFDDVVIIPSYQNPWKKSTDYIHRFKMCELAFPDYVISAAESVLAKVRGVDSIYTYDLLKFLTEKIYKNQYVYLLLTKETEAEIPKWYKGEEIPNLVRYWVEDKNFFIDNVKEFHSTNIRKLISENKSISGMVHPDVENYIINNNLYKLI